jgi:hypothetical protein
MKSKSKSHCDWWSISKSWCRTPSRIMTRYLLLFDSYGLVFWGALSNERTGLSFVYATGPRQRSLSWVRVSWDSWLYFTVSDLRLPFRCLLRLAGSRWRYFTPPPHGQTKSKAKSKLCCDRRSVGQSVLVSSTHLGLTTRFFITVRELRVCWCGALSLTRERVCRLQLLLGLANAVILGSESHGTRDHILLSQIRDSPNLEGQVPVFISPRDRVAQLYPQALGSISSPPTTRRATLEVFGQDSTRPHRGQSQSHIATDGQSISKSWCRAPSGAHDRIFITLWPLWSCFSGAPSLTRGRVCLFICCWPSSA